jgi:predicted HicB family RNase H-like nuclease
MPERRRTSTLNVRVYQEEADMLKELADRDGLSISDWIRQAIRQRHRKLFGERPQDTRRPRRTVG